MAPALLVGLSGLTASYLVRSKPSRRRSSPPDEAAQTEKDSLDAEFEPEKFKRRQAIRKASLLAVLAFLELNSLGRIAVDIVAEGEGGAGRVAGDGLMALFWVSRPLLFRDYLERSGAHTDDRATGYREKCSMLIVAALRWSTWGWRRFRSLCRVWRWTGIGTTRSP